jgi:hypothetical protein
LLLSLVEGEMVAPAVCQTLDNPDVHDIATLNVLTNQEAVFVSW